MGLTWVWWPWPQDRCCVWQWKSSWGTRRHCWSWWDASHWVGTPSEHSDEEGWFWRGQQEGEPPTSGNSNNLLHVCAYTEIVLTHTHAITHMHAHALYRLLIRRLIHKTEWGVQKNNLETPRGSCIHVYMYMSALSWLCCPAQSVYVHVCMCVNCAIKTGPTHVRTVFQHHKTANMAGHTRLVKTYYKPTTYSQCSNLFITPNNYWYSHVHSCTCVPYMYSL